MGLLLFLFLLPACVVIIYRRRRTRTSLIVPLVLLVYANIAAAWFVLGAIRSAAMLSRLPDPSSKATVLATWISETINGVAVGLIVNIPLVIGAYLMDRRLVRCSSTT